MAHEIAGCDPVFDGRGVARDADGRPVRLPVAVAEVRRPEDLDLDASPALVVWEATRSYGLPCAACGTPRRRDPEELSTMDALRLMNDVRGFGPVAFVITGGDPLRREDLLQLVGHGSRIGLRMGLALPCGAQPGTLFLRSLRRRGLGRLSVRLHRVPTGGPGGGVDGAGVRTLMAARDVGLPTQADTLLGPDTPLEAMGAALAELGVGRWSVAFPVARAQVEALGPVQAELRLRALRELDGRLPLEVRVTRAPQWRRLAAAEGQGGAAAVRDGRGILFVAYDGALQPSRHVPRPAGQARSDDAVEVYRSAGLFQTLRDAAALKGKCGVCEHRDVCGGSRARALAVKGDVLEEDPLCPYLPVGASRRGTAATP